MKNAVRSIAILLVLVMFITLFLTSCNKEENNTQENYLEEDYNRALALIESKKYEEAYALLKELGNYKDADKELKKFRYIPAGGTHKTMVGSDVDSLAMIIASYNENYLPKQLAFTYPNGQKVAHDYTFDDNGNLTREIHTDLDNNKIIYTYIYDDSGRLEKKIYMHSDGETVYNYTYDDKGNLVKESLVYQYSGNQIYFYIYDDKGNLIKKVYTGSDVDNPVYDYTYTYDDKGNLVQTVLTYRDHYAYASGTKAFYDYTYDENGNLVKAVFTYPNGKDKYSYEYTYDDNGNLTKERYTDVGRVTHKNEYTYDDNGNPVIKVSASLLDSVCELEYRLVYIPFELSDEEFEELYMKPLGFYSYKDPD